MPRQRSRSQVRFSSYPLAAVAIADNVLGMVNSAGFITTAVAAASNRGCVGMTVGAVDNSGGSAGDLEVLLEEGIFTLTAVGATQAELHTTAYASAGSTVSSTQAANEPIAGIIMRFRTSTSVDVLVSAEAAHHVAL